MSRVIILQNENKRKERKGPIQLRFPVSISWRWNSSENFCGIGVLSKTGGTSVSACFFLKFSNQKLVS